MSPIAPCPMRRGRAVAGRQQLGLDGHRDPFPRRRPPKTAGFAPFGPEKRCNVRYPQDVRPWRPAWILRAAGRPSRRWSALSQQPSSPPWVSRDPRRRTRRRRAGATFFVSGHGWGHGVGLAQYGAYGYALHGWAADDIVAHYYPGTDLGQAPVKRVRVLLVPGSKRVVVSSRSPFTVQGRRRQDAQAAGRQAAARAGPEAEARRVRQGAAGPARLLARDDAARARRPRLPRLAAA